MQKVYSRQGYEKEFKDLNKAHPYWTDEFKKNAKDLSVVNEKYEKTEQDYRKQEDDFNAKEDAYKKADETYKTLDASGASPEALADAQKIKDDANKNRIAPATLDNIRKNREDVKKEFEKTKSQISNQFKEFNWSKSADLTESIVSNPDSAEFKAIAITLSEAPFKEGLGKFLTKISVKNNIQETRMRRKNMVLETINHTVKGGDLKMAGRLIGNLNGSPGAFASGYSAEPIFKELKERKGVTEEQIKEIRKISKITEKRKEEAEEFEAEGFVGVKKEEKIEEKKEEKPKEEKS